MPRQASQTGHAGDLKISSVLLLNFVLNRGFCAQSDVEFYPDYRDCLSILKKKKKKLDNRCTTIRLCAFHNARFATHCLMEAPNWQQLSNLFVVRMYIVCGFIEEDCLENVRILSCFV